MIRISKGHVRSWLLVVPFMTFKVANAADESAQLAPASPPLTMARFYIVDSEGRSASDKDIVAQTVPTEHRSSEPRRKKSIRRPRHGAGKARNRSGHRDTNVLRANAAKAWQCERHGFFFTADGRCIWPVIRVRQERPPPTRRPPIRTNLRPN